MMHTKLDFGTTSRIQTSQLPAGRDAIPPTKRYPSKPGPTYQPAGVNPSAQTIRFSPFDCEEIVLPEWRQDIEDHFETIFQNRDLSTCSIDSVVAQALRIIGSPTQENMRALARTIFLRWMRKKLRDEDVRACSPKTIALISRIAIHLGCISANAEKDFLDELRLFSIRELKHTWYSYSNGEAKSSFYEAVFREVMAIVTMIGHLYHGGQIQYEDALDGLEYIAKWMHRSDALVIIYVFLRELGREFVQEQTAFCFIHSLLANVVPLAEALPASESESLRQSVSAIKTLAAQWSNDTYGAGHNTYVKKNNQFHAHLLQM